MSKKLLGYRNPQNAAHTRSTVNVARKESTGSGCKYDETSPLMFDQFSHILFD
jgi:hypothetical protein